MKTSSQSLFNSRWIKPNLLLVLTVLLSGCWATSIKPPVSEIDRLGSVLIVPVESPPLEISPDPIEQRIPAYAHYRNMAIDFSAPQKLYKTSGGVMIAGFVSETDDAQDLIILDERMPQSLAIAAGPEQAWTPTLVLARQAMAQLNENHINAVLSRDYYRLPMADADRNAQLAHWHDATVAWYGQNATSADYRPYTDVDAVLELGLGNYRIFAGQTTVQVLMKLVDPRTRQVIARTRAGTVAIEEAGRIPLNRDSEPFKQLVSKMSLSLLKQGLNDMGWRL